jgi:hypothetical protein
MLRLDGAQRETEDMKAAALEGQYRDAKEAALRADQVRRTYPEYGRVASHPYEPHWAPWWASAYRPTRVEQHSTRVFLEDAASHCKCVVVRAPTVHIAYEYVFS